MENKNNLRLIAARDVILAYLMKEDFTIGESEQVLEMCRTEIGAWEKRSKLTKIEKEEE